MANSTVTRSGLGMTLQKPAQLLEPSRENESGYSLDELSTQHWMFKEIVCDFEYVGLKVCKIEYLSNHLLWQKYTNEKTSIEQRKPQDPAFELNEKYLYHGSSAIKEFICTEGLDARLSKNGCFGRGIYFSDNPLKCVKYAEKGKNASYILLERVILGSSKVYPDGKKDQLLAREPEKEKPYKGWRFYDSLMGRPRDHKEFVVYNNDRALIECVITYSKAENNTASSMPGASKLAVSSSSSKCDHKSHPVPNTKAVFAASNAYSRFTPKKIGYDDNDSTDKSDSSDSDGGSSDSSMDLEDGKDQGRKYLGKSTLKNTTPEVKRVSAEDILSEKRKQFRLMTGECRNHVIETFLSSAGLDVDKAVRLFFFQKDQKKMEMKKRLIRDREEEEKEEKAKEAKMEEIASASALPDPVTDPERWKQLPAEDKDAICAVHEENFLTVTDLEDNDENRRLSRKVLLSCDYNPDQAIVLYYNSL